MAGEQWSSRLGFMLATVGAAVGLGNIWRFPAVLGTNGGGAYLVPYLLAAVVCAVPLLVLFVYMAFTVLLIPVAIAGLLGELLIVLYGQVAFGYLLGRRLPVREDVATVVGVVGFLLAVELLGLVPTVGAVVQLALVAVGFGAVVNTYFGVTRFDPVAIPAGGER